MAKLILTMDGLVLREISLLKERTTIGRKPTNDVQIDNLSVSGEHAVIVTILTDSFLEDLGSTNGTTVNGTPVKKHFLQPDDVIELGKYKLKYISEAKQAVGAADFERTMVLRPGQKPPPLPAKPPAATAVPTAATPATPAAVPATAAPVATAPPVAEPPVQVPVRQAALRIQSGANTGKELILMKALTTLGKPGVQVAVLTKRPQGFFISHVEGNTPPLVNGKPLTAKAHPLNDKDQIDLAGTKMEFFYK